MLYAIIVKFAMLAASLHGEAVADDRFKTLAECEAARPGMTEGIRRVLEDEHGPLILESHCGLASELDGEPA